MDRRQRRFLGRQQARTAGRQRPLSTAPVGQPTPAAPATLDAVIRDAVRLAEERQAGGQINEARQLYSGVLEIQPSHPDALLGLAKLARQIGQTEVAGTLLARAV